MTQFICPGCSQKMINGTYLKTLRKCPNIGNECCIFNTEKNYLLIQKNQNYEVIHGVFQKCASIYKKLKVFL